MLIITQEPWHVETAAQRLLSLAEAAREQFGEIEGGLLLPLGEAGPKRLRPEQDVLADAGSVADGLGIHIAGAAPMIAAHSDKPQTVGFVVGADGAAALRCPKITPDFLEGFSDTACEDARSLI